MHRDEVRTEREHREQGPADSRRDLRALRQALERGGHAAAHRCDEADRLETADMVTGDGDAPDHGDAGREGGDRRDDADRSRRHAAVEREQPDRACHGRERRPRHLVAGDPRATHGDGDAERGEAERLRRGHHQQAGHDPCLHAAEEVADAPGEAGAERQ